MSAPRLPQVLLALLGLLITSAFPVEAGRLRDDLDLVARDVRELERLLATERERSSRLEAQLAELRRLTGVDEPGRLGAADLGARLDGLDRDVQVLFENQNETQRRLAVLGDKLDALYRHQSVFGLPPGSGGGEAMTAPAAEEPESSDGRLPSAPPIGREAMELAEHSEEERFGTASSAPTDPEELYRSARADYGRGEYALAVEGFEEFALRFPSSELSDNAMYWVGESHWAQRHFVQALSAFDSVLQSYPGGDKVADAGLKRGLCLLELNRMADGIIQLQHVKDSHPGTPASRLAREKLESLGLL